MVSTFLVTGECAELNSTYECPNVKVQLGNLRRRRHLNFPDGSNFVVSTILFFKNREMENSVVILFKYEI